MKPIGRAAIMALLLASAGCATAPAEGGARFGGGYGGVKAGGASGG